MGAIVKIGRLRHWVTLLASAPANRDATGAPIYAYTNAGTFPAEVRTLSADELQRIEIDSLVGTVVHQVTLRKGGVRPRATWRVQWDGRTFEVQGVMEPDNRGRIVQLLCVEILL